MGNVLSSIGNTISGIFGGSSATSQGQSQSNALGQAGNVATIEDNNFSRYFGNLMSNYMQMLGYNPATKSFTSGFNPYFNTDGTPNTLGSQITNQFTSAETPAYQHAVDQANHDLISEGYTGANSVSPSVISNIRTQQAANNADFLGNLGVQGANEQFQRVAGAVGGLQGIGNNAAGISSGLANQYGNIANQVASNGNDLLSVLGQIYAG